MVNEIMGRFCTYKKKKSMHMYMHFLMYVTGTGKHVSKYAVVTGMFPYCLNSLIHSKYVFVYVIKCTALVKVNLMLEFRVLSHKARSLICSFFHEVVYPCL
jgi:hypothetical protein